MAYLTAVCTSGATTTSPCPRISTTGLPPSAAARDLPRQPFRTSIAAAAVRAGSQLLVFPEGTRTRREPVNHFEGGFALIAKTARVPVQTVFIETNSLFLSKGWPLFRKPAFPLIYRARLGRRFEVKGDVKALVAELECYYRKTLAAGTSIRVDANQ